MPRILAIDWDRREVRGMLLSAGPTGTTVSGAWVASLDAVEPTAFSGKQIGSALAAEISAQLGGKLTTIVGVARDSVQMQLLTLPPAPDNELPELVRFQAEREFTTLGSDAALDFIPLAGDAQTPRQVLAVALSPAGIAEAKDVCASLDLQPDRIALRACAAAELVRRAAVVAEDRIALIVNPLKDEADLTVQANDKMLLMRTVRLPDVDQGAVRQRTLLSEIRRTMAAARQQLTDRTVDQVVVCGNAAGIHDSDSLADALDVPVVLFDPVTQAPSGLTSQGLPEASLVRFAAVLGMALSEADRRPPIVDFVNVRRQVSERRFNRVHALAAAAAVLVVLLFGAHLWRQIAHESRQLSELEGQIQDTRAQAELYEEATTHAAQIERWLATDVNWLDELEEFARRVRPEPLSADDFPVGDDVVVTQLTLLRPPGVNSEGGRMDVQAKAKSPEAVRNLEHRLRDERRRVTPRDMQQDSTLPGYPLATDLQIHVLPPSDDDATASTTPANEEDAQ